ncbi:MAG: 50S ribosomal protein L4 [Planctomycetes bacterium]|nr:50S ribosomal protein L4 [Planctomycetota bacterium]
MSPTEPSTPSPGPSAPAESAAPLLVPVRGLAGEDKGQLPVPPERLDSQGRHPLLKEAVVMYEANRRVGTHATKTRSEVAGSTRKPWKQKGTGRARAGSRKSPLWRGGGIIFGPHPRDYSYAINRKQRRLALRAALHAKFRDGQVVVLDGLRLEAPKTKVVQAALKALGVQGSCLIGTGSSDRNLHLSARNIPGVSVSPLKDFNALEVLKARRIVLTREAFDELCGGPGAAGAPEGSPQA